MQKIDFSNESLSTLPCPHPGQRIIYYDSTTNYLTLRVTHKGTKTFMVYMKHLGRPVKRIIGHYPGVSVATARQRCREIVADLTTEAKSTQSGLLTVQDLFDKYYEGYVQHRCKTAEDILKSFHRYLAPIANVPATELTPYAIQQLHNEIGSARGRTTANRALQLLRTIFNYAERWGLYDGRNPGRAVKPFPEEARKRFLNDQEIPVLLAAIHRHATPKVRDFLKMCLFTGQRFANVCGMSWEHLDLNAGVWHIPGREMKNGENHDIPLPVAALEILNRRRTEVSGPWVFPSRRGKGHLVKPHRYWYDILEKTGLQNLRIHDLRRTHGTWQAATGATLIMVGRTLGHKTPSATAIYARLPLEPVRQAMETAVTAMLSSPTTPL